MKDIPGSFLVECKRHYQEGIFPAMLDNNSKSTLIAIAKNYIDQYGFKSFSNYFQEYQYCVDLYTAHLIIKLNASDALKDEALEIVKRYACSALNEEVAKQETDWLMLKEK